MTASATTTATNTANATKPAFTRVESSYPVDCGAFACIATIAGKSLAEVMQIAVDRHNHPAVGPYYVTEDLIAKIFASFGYVSTVYKEVKNGWHEVGSVSIALVDYRADEEIGRHVVFVRDDSNKKAIVTYLLDPAPWLPPDLHIRNDFANLKPAYFISVQPMAQKAGKS